MNTTYKGFEIEFSSNGITIDSGRYYVLDTGFKPEGYATLNNAKGAITKHLQTVLNKPQPEQYMSDSEMDSSMDATEYLLSSPANAAHLERSIAQLPIRINVDNMTALMRFHGFIKSNGKPRKSDKRSRNQREGKYAGKINGGVERGNDVDAVESYSSRQDTRKARKFFNGY